MQLNIGTKIQLIKENISNEDLLLKLENHPELLTKNLTIKSFKKADEDEGIECFDVIVDEIPGYIIFANEYEIVSEPDERLKDVKRIIATLYHEHDLGIYQNKSKINKLTDLVWRNIKEHKDIEASKHLVIQIMLENIE